MFTQKELLYWSLMKRSERYNRFGSSAAAQILSITVKYIDNDEMLLKLLRLNRELNEVLKEPVIKQLLIRTNQSRLSRKRVPLWLQILRIDPA